MSENRRWILHLESLTLLHLQLKILDASSSNLVAHMLSNKLIKHWCLWEPDNRNRPRGPDSCVDVMRDKEFYI